MAQKEIICDKTGKRKFIQVDGMAQAQLDFIIKQLAKKKQKSNDENQTENDDENCVE